jgi:uncharacterized protein YjbI with pentapeptide repeats
MSDEDGSKRPVPEGFDSWKAYWKARGMEWRTEPEIGDKRQLYLRQRRTIKPDREHGLYPFRDESGAIKLDRADVEWLLATHESGGLSGPVEWHNTKQRDREGLDLRGADLQGANLANLPLARLRGGPEGNEWDELTTQQREHVQLHLERAVLSGAHLEGALLTGARLDGATLYHAQCEQAQFGSAHLEDALLAHASLAGAIIWGTYFDVVTNTYQITLHTPQDGPAFISDCRWSDMNVTTIDWSQMTKTGAEVTARTSTNSQGKRKGYATRTEEYLTAVRASRQLATLLRSQGVNEQADRFAYRSQVLQRAVLRRQGKFLRYTGSLLLDLLAGYGYRPARAILLYLAVILWFANFYIWATHGLITFGLAPSHLQPLAWYETLVLSVSSFHGRGFLPFTNLGDPVTILAAMEAILGLVIEVSFIATFTQRFFGK